MNYWLLEVENAVLVYKTYPPDQYDDMEFRRLWALGKLICEGEK
jgi:hypothetical protein